MSENILAHFFALDCFERCENRRHRQHSAAERRAEIVCFYRIEIQSLTRHAPTGTPLPKDLASVIMSASVFPAKIASRKKPISGSSDSRLHFVKN